MCHLYIFTLTWNACDKLTKLKESLMTALDNIDYTWLIKDNDSKDNTYEIASTWGSKIKCFKYKNNLQNFSQGMNYLFSEASPNDNDMILLLNNDIIFNDNKSIRNMISLLTKDTGAVGARLLYTGTNKLQHAGVVFDPKHSGPVHFRAGEISDDNAEKNRYFQVVTGAVLLTKAEYFRNSCKNNKSGINGMDESFHWAFDDVDLCLSIRYNMDKKVVYCGQTNISHEESSSLKKNPANRLFMNHNWNVLRNKWSKHIVADKDLYDKDTNYNLVR
jgi:GT2 family glycosyltransferase